MTRKMVLVILALMIAIGIIGCMHIQMKPTIKKQAEKQLKKKYHEKFKVYGGGAASQGVSYGEIYATSKTFPNAKILVRKDAKSGEILDNYMDYLMKSKVEAAMNDIVSKVYPKSKVLFDTQNVPIGGVTQKMSVDEYIKYIGEHIHLSLTICVDDPNYKKDTDQKVEALRKQFEEKHYSPMFYIFYLKPDKLDLVSDSNYLELYDSSTEKDWALMRGDFWVNESLEIQAGGWRTINDQ